MPVACHCAVDFICDVAACLLGGVAH